MGIKGTLYIDIETKLLECVAEHHKRRGSEGEMGTEDLPYDQRNDSKQWKIDKVGK